MVRATKKVQGTFKDLYAEIEGWITSALEKNST